MCETIDMEKCIFEDKAILFGASRMASRIFFLIGQST